MNNHPEENLPLDENMVNRATRAMEALIGPLLAEQADNPYLDADQYTKALCKAYTEQVLNAAFHDLARLSYSTEEQVRAEKKVLGTPVDRAHGCGTVQWWMNIQDVPPVMGKFIRDKAGHRLVRLPEGWLYQGGPNQGMIVKLWEASDMGPFTEAI